MVAVTYGVARAAAGALKSKGKAKSAAPGLLSRWFKAVQESRLRQAERELALHGFVRNSKDNDVPFVRGW